MTLPLNILLRGLAVYIVNSQESALNLSCLSMPADQARRYLCLYFFFVDSALFRTNIFILLFVAVPIYLALVAPNASYIQNEELDSCVEPGWQKGLKMLSFLPVSLPYVIGAYMQSLNEIKLFLRAENIARQQKIVL